MVKRTLLFGVVFLLNEGAAAAGEVDAKLERYCRDVWPQEEKPAPKKSMECAEIFVMDSYGLGFTLEDLSLDASIGGKTALRYAVATFDLMARNVRNACPKCVVSECKDNDRRCLIGGRAVEIFTGQANVRGSMFDSSRMANLDIVMHKIVSGKPIQMKELSHWSLVSLWKLRNAVFARHGRKFKNPDLNDFFYGKGGAKKRFPTLKENKGYSDSMLTKVDRKNIARVRKAESKK